MLDATILLAHWLILNPFVFAQKSKKAEASLDSQIRWGRRLIGRTLRSLIDLFDAPTALALLTAGERGRLHLTPGKFLPIERRCK